MSVPLTEEQNKFIKQIAQDNGFNDYEVTTCSAAGKGDNFMGIVIAVTIKSGEKKLNLILKGGLQIESLRNVLPCAELYSREKYLYETIFNEFKKYQEKFNIIDPFEGMAKLYGGSEVEGKEFLVMENLKSQGYQHWNRQELMNPEHISFVLKEYAKFHAISIAMSKKNPELFEKLAKRLTKTVFEKEDVTTADHEMFKISMKSTFANVEKAVENDPALTEYLKLFESKFADIFTVEAKKPQYKLVITHADCWCNNIFFKYKVPTNNKKPNNLRFIDWQLSFLTSPAYDLCYFFLAHSPKLVLDDYKSYLKLYYTRLSRQLHNFKCDPDEVFPFSKLEEHCKIFMILGMYTGIMVTKVLVSNPEEAPLGDLGSKKDAKDFLKGFDSQVNNADVYNERIRVLFEFMRANNF